MGSQELDMTERLSAHGARTHTHTHTHTHTYKIDNHGNLLYDSGNSNWGSVTTERGGNICIPVADSC